MAAVPFLKGYSRRISLTDAERDRLAGLLFSRQLIDIVFRVCRDPSTTVRQASKLKARREECQAKAQELLSI